MATRGICPLPDEVKAAIRTGVALTSFAQAVEELVLNSVDAGATSIAVRVDLPYFKIQVVDNGGGISLDQLSFVGERYSTSKCRSAEDLENLKYFGYRGEAIASMASTSLLLEITSRASNSRLTHTKHFHHGKPQPLVQASAPRPCTGTTVTAFDMFHNLPVRRKRLSEALEMEAIRYRLSGIALVWPQVSFSLRDDSAGHVILQTHKCSGMAAVFSNIFTPARARKLMEVDAVQKEEFKISGLVSTEGYSRKDIQFVFVNKRLVLKSAIHKQVNKILGRSLILRRKGFNNDVAAKLPTVGDTMDGSPTKQGDKHGIYVMSIECPYSAYDITFDPAKTLVEFRDWPKLIHLLQDMLYPFLRKHNLLASGESDSPSIPGDGEESEKRNDFCEATGESSETVETLIGENSQAARQLFKYGRTICITNTQNGILSKSVHRPKKLADRETLVKTSTSQSSTTSRGKSRNEQCSVSSGNQDNDAEDVLPSSSLLRNEIISSEKSFEKLGTNSLTNKNTIQRYAHLLECSGFDNKHVRNVEEKINSDEKQERPIQQVKPRAIPETRQCSGLDDNALHKKAVAYEGNSKKVRFSASANESPLPPPSMPKSEDVPTRREITLSGAGVNVYSSTLGSLRQYCGAGSFTSGSDKGLKASGIITNTLQQLRKSTQQAVRELGDLYKTPERAVTRRRSADGSRDSGSGDSGLAKQARVTPSTSDSSHTGIVNNPQGSNCLGVATNMPNNCDGLNVKMVEPKEARGFDEHTHSQSVLPRYTHVKGLVTKPAATNASGSEVDFSSCAQRHSHYSGGSKTRPYSDIPEDKSSETDRGHITNAESSRSVLRPVKATKIFPSPTSTVEFPHHHVHRWHMSTKRQFPPKLTKATKLAKLMKGEKVHKNEQDSLCKTKSFLQDFQYKGSNKNFEERTVSRETIDKICASDISNEEPAETTCCRGSFCHSKLKNKIESSNVTPRNLQYKPLVEDSETSKWDESTHHTSFRQSSVETNLVSHFKWPCMEVPDEENRFCVPISSQQANSSSKKSANTAHKGQCVFSSPSKEESQNVKRHCHCTGSKTVCTQACCLHCHKSSCCSHIDQIPFEKYKAPENRVLSGEGCPKVSVILSLPLVQGPSGKQNNDFANLPSRKESSVRQLYSHSKPTDTNKNFSFVSTEEASDNSSEDSRVLMKSQGFSIIAHPQSYMPLSDDSNGQSGFLIRQKHAPSSPTVIIQGDFDKQRSTRTKILRSPSPPLLVSQGFSIRETGNLSVSCEDAQSERPMPLLLKQTSCEKTPHTLTRQSGDSSSHIVQDTAANVCLRSNGTKESVSKSTVSPSFVNSPQCECDSITISQGIISETEDLNFLPLSGTDSDVYLQVALSPEKVDDDCEQLFSITDTSTKSGRFCCSSANETEKNKDTGVAKLYAGLTDQTQDNHKASQSFKFRNPLPQSGFQSNDLAQSQTTHPSQKLPEQVSGQNKTTSTAKDTNTDIDSSIGRVDKADTAQSNATLHKNYGIQKLIKAGIHSFSMEINSHCHKTNQLTSLSKLQSCYFDGKTTGFSDDNVSVHVTTTNPTMSKTETVTHPVIESKTKSSEVAAGTVYPYVTSTQAEKASCDSKLKSLNFTKISESDSLECQKSFESLVDCVTLEKSKYYRVQMKSQALTDGAKSSLVSSPEVGKLCHVAGLEQKDCNDSSNQDNTQNAAGRLALTSNLQSSSSLTLAQRSGNQGITLSPGSDSDTFPLLSKMPVFDNLMAGFHNSDVTGTAGESEKNDMMGGSESLFEDSEKGVLESVHEDIFDTCANPSHLSVIHHGVIDVGQQQVSSNLSTEAQLKKKSITCKEMSSQKTTVHELSFIASHKPSATVGAQSCERSKDIINSGNNLSTMDRDKDLSSWSSGDQALLMVPTEEKTSSNATGSSNARLTDFYSNKERQENRHDSGEAELQVSLTGTGDAEPQISVTGAAGDSNRAPISVSAVLSAGTLENSLSLLKEHACKEKQGCGDAENPSLNTQSHTNTGFEEILHAVDRSQFSNIDCTQANGGCKKGWDTSFSSPNYHNTNVLNNDGLDLEHVSDFDPFSLRDTTESKAREGTVEEDVGSESLSRPDELQESHLSQSQSVKDDTASKACWRQEIDTRTGARVYVNNQSGHTITEEQWPEMSSQSLREMTAVEFQSPRESESKPGQELPPLSPSGRQALTDVINKHVEEADAEAESKWRGGKKFTYEKEAGMDVSTILAKWNNPTFLNYKPASLCVESCPRGGVAKSCFNSLSTVEFTKDMLNKVKVIGQVDNKFIACEVEQIKTTQKDTPSSLLILLDQHAVHERVRLEYYKKECYTVSGGELTNNLQKAELSSPQTVCLDQDDVRILRAFSREFARIGVNFSIDEKSRTIVYINSIPACLMEREAGEVKRKKAVSLEEKIECLIKEHIDLLKSTNGSCGRLPLTVHKHLCSVACHGAVKFGDPLTLSECRDLLSSLARCNLPFQCAHGRPAIAPLVDITSLEEELTVVKKLPSLWKLSTNK